MSTQAVECPICGSKVFRNKSGQLLMHTTQGYHGAPPQICRGGTRGARP